MIWRKRAWKKRKKSVCDDLNAADVLHSRVIEGFRGGHGALKFLIVPAEHGHEAEDSQRHDECKTIVNRLQGDITVRSEIGKGTRFLVDLPVNMNIHENK